ncbi:hypothetical protein [Bradyrhizobium sp. CCGB20]|uniref:hypothetical protein n=1 Tax=Bradyrhizobium sp. CCGB20 TaxID=2949633 RepID=UPI0020B42190|nr:hypothetical protein [Bradyrhizobium sp. CCGB20]MCP3397329.1 hypothetical protein [Bradyrhizobium sp. CCGB20]
MVGFRPVDRDMQMFEAAAIVLRLVDQHPEAGVAPRAPFGTIERAPGKSKTTS